MPVLLSLLQLLRSSQKKMLVAVACGLLFAGTGLAPPPLIRQIIQWITEGGGTLSALAGITGLLLVVYIGRGLFRYGYGRFSHEVSFDVLHSLMVRAQDLAREWQIGQPGEPPELALVTGSD